MNQRRASGFNVRTVLLAVIASFAAFVATLYFISIGDTSNRGENDGRAHAASNGLDGFAGFAKLLELEGHDVTLSRSRGGMETYGLLVLTPPMQTDPEEFAQILEDRYYYGPTLVILPKWWTSGFPDQLPVQTREEIKDGWVRLGFATSADWTSQLGDLYEFEHVLSGDREDEGSSANNQKPAPIRWSGFGISGELPTQFVTHTAAKDTHDALVRSPDGKVLAFELFGDADSEFYNEAERVIFVTEPDLINNYGMADSARAKLAMELVKELSYEGQIDVTFDLTLNGLGGAQNLLTLVFQPPFLAATLCLLAAMIMIGWRAFRRFGPARVEAPAHAFGKGTLVTNSAGLILRAKRLPLLTAPYAELMTRRIAKRLGLVRYDNDTLDAALARTLPDEPPVTLRTNALREAQSPKDILDAANSLHELERKLTR